MKILQNTSNISFSAMANRSDLIAVYAGCGMAVGIKRDHGIVQVCSSMDYALREQYWTRVRQAAISGIYPGLCMGLIEDGTCMISKRALRQNLSDAQFARVNDWVKSLRDVVQIAVNDVLFAVHADGTVSMMPVDGAYGILSMARNPFAESNPEESRNIRKIVTASQEGFAGLTYDGKVLLGGANLTNAHSYTAELRSVRALDLCFSGSEAEACYYIDAENGAVYDPGTKARVTPEGVRFQKLCANAFYNVYALAENGDLYEIGHGSKKIMSGCRDAAAGVAGNYAGSFAIAIP